jgi:curved DNA-binding protein CbpA
VAWNDRPGGDPYQILGVAAGASQQDIVRAYHRAAHHAHPDERPADPEAAARFRALTDAYELLSDTGRRADYDRRRAGQQRAVRHARTQLRASPGGMPGRWAGAPLWAGPVHIGPPGGQAAGASRARPWPGRPAEIADVLDWYLERAWGRLW